MKRLYLCFMFLAIALTAQENNQPTGPSLVFESATQDMGLISKDRKVTTYFHFSNTGQADLTIAEIKTSCGCTSAQLTKRVYGPGESGRIPVTVDPSRLSGKLTRSVTVLSDDARFPEQQLRVNLEVENGSTTLSMAEKSLEN